MSAAERRICIVPRVSGVGGMVSFQHKLIAGLEARGYQPLLDLAETPYAAVLVIGGTRDLSGLWQVRRQGIPIVQRLNGMNWLHRRAGWRTWLSLSGLRHALRAENGNRLLRLIRDRLASRVIYQSHFAQGWWQRTYGVAPIPAQVIYNGVDLDQYSPNGPECPPDDRWRILMVEGSLQGGYEQGLEAAVGMLVRLAADAPQGRPVELQVVGRVPADIQQRWQAYVAQHTPPERGRIVWAGLAERQAIPALDRSAHLLYSSDINAACPNSVIEALACGLPVLAFDTGALPELVPPAAGRVVPYGGDPWRLDPPDVLALARAAGEILTAGPALRQSARQHAEANFGLPAMVEAYLQQLLG